MIKGRKANRCMGIGAGALSVVAICGPTHAATVTITQTLDDGTHAATAIFIFDDSGATTTLSIQLINDMSVTGEGTNPQWLQGLFFDMAGSPTMSYLGLGGDGSDDFNDMIQLSPGATDTDPDPFVAYTDVTVDHFWGLRQDIAGGELPFGTQQYGLAAAGFGVFSEDDVLNLQATGPLPQLDGSDGGILSATLLDSGSINLPDGHTREMVDGGIWLTFDLGDYQFDESSISDVSFVFGTSFGEIVLVPVPLALPMGLAGLAGIAACRRRLQKVVAA